MASKQTVLTTICLVVATSLASCQQTGSTRTEILWDSWGVPHIYATSDESLFRAFGWAQMESHGDLVLRLYGEARARAAEYWGEEHAENDRWLLTMGVPARAQEWYDKQSVSFRRYLDAFADGINGYAREHSDKLDDEFEVVLPVSAIDVLAHAQRVILFTFVSSRGDVESLHRRWQTAGSNAWAIGPNRSASGNAMLLANPHLWWSDLFRFYEAQLTSPGFDAYGAALVGFPVLGIAFNDYLGWTHTVNTLDGADLYELSPAGDGYLWRVSEGRIGLERFEIRNHTVRVKLPSGELDERPLQVRWSAHGPVVANKAGAALALRVVGLESSGFLESWWDMARAANLTEFESVLRRMQLPMFTVIYADRDGHIMHLFGGLTPIRPEGDWDWAGIVPGNHIQTLWTEIHPYDDLPKVVDPESGWLQNANDPPWTTTFPRQLDPDDFPDYMAPRFMHFRAQRSARMLAEDEQINFDELVEYKHSTRMELADRIVDDLVAAAREHGNAKANEAADVLEAWDHDADADSRGAVLFTTVIRELFGPGGPSPFEDPPRVFARAWSPEAPLDTPDGLSDPGAAAAALESAARQVEANWGSVDVAFGEVFRLRVGGLDLAANGISDNFGAFRTTWYRRMQSGVAEAFGGDSYVAAVEFSDPVRAMAVIGYGNASQPGSPHLSDQLQFYYSKKMRPVWLTRKEVEANLSERTVF